MARIPEEVVEAIRQKVDIVDVVSQYVQLKKSGKNLFGLCPFHEEKTPSFSVSEDKQIFHCFSCGRGGNVFKFMMDMEQLTFPEAVVKVAQMNNIAIDAQYTKASQTPVSNEIQQLRQLYQQAQTLYHHILVNTQLGQPALHYLQQRGMTDETIEIFKIGYAPDKTDLLTLFFQDKKVAPALLRTSGLFAVTQDERLLDRFTDRVMFPIHDQNGQVIAFSGRTLSKAKDVPKYLNSPETKLFNKRKELFNYDLAKGEIRRQKGVLLFEGFMDVISAFQAGVQNGVASMGTSLTDEQLYLLQRTTSHLLICYDGDGPGVIAANRAVDMLGAKPNLDLGVIVLPDGLDPDEFIKQKGPEAFQKVIANGEQTALHFKLGFLRRDVNLGNEKAKFDYLTTALNLLKQQATPTEQSLYIKELAADLDIDVQAIRQQFDDLPGVSSATGLSAKGKYQRQGPQPVVKAAYVTTPVKYNQLEKAERALLFYLLHDDSLCRRLVAQENFHFTHVTYQMMYELWLTYLTSHDSATLEGFMDQLPPDMQNTLTDLEMSTFPEDGRQAIDDFLAIISSQDVKQQLKKAQQSLKIANETGNADEELYWTNEVIQLSKRLKGA